MAERSPPAFVVVGLIVLGGLAGGVVVSNSFGFLGDVKGAENLPTQGLASSVPTPDSASGTVVTNVTVGFYPVGVGYDSGNGYVYVTGGDSNTVRVISGTKIVATVPLDCGPHTVEFGPRGVAYDGANGYVYVTNFGVNKVTVINGTTVVATVTLPDGSGPWGVAYDSGNGYIFVTNGASGSVSVINGTTVVGWIRVGGGPIDLAYDSRNGYVYVANGAEDYLTVISTTSLPSQSTRGLATPAPT